MSLLHIQYLKQQPYADVLQLQQELFNNNIQSKLNNQPTQNHLILCEHEPVFTLGKSGKSENVMVNDKELKASIVKIDRGGDVTFHGPGQLVAYPILDLDSLHIGVSQYIHQLEDVIIHTLAAYGLTCARLPGSPGIWIDADKPTARKIAAIGAKVSRHITMHGLAINVNTDLSWFDKIVSCGIKDKGVTSLQKELARSVEMEDFKEKFLSNFKQAFTAEKSAESLS